MKLTFPRFGDSNIYGRLLFRELGVDFVVPAPNLSLIHISEPTRPY